MRDIPDRVQSEIDEAVMTAIMYGTTPQEFVRAAREAWSNELREKAKRDDNAFARCEAP